MDKRSSLGGIIDQYRGNKPLTNSLINTSLMFGLGYGGGRLATSALRAFKSDDEAGFDPHKAGLTSGLMAALMFGPEWGSLISNYGLYKHNPSAGFWNTMNLPAKWSDNPTSVADYMRTLPDESRWSAGHMNKDYLGRHSYPSGATPSAGAVELNSILNRYPQYKYISSDPSMPDLDTVADIHGLTRRYHSDFKN
jgi:hypothetical protein